MMLSPAQTSLSAHRRPWQLTQGPVSGQRCRTVTHARQREEDACTRPTGSLQRRTLLGAMVGLVAAGVAQLPQASALEVIRPTAQETDSNSIPWVQEMQRRTEEKREERRVERLNNYYKRNYSEYFQYEASDPTLAARRGIKPETQAAIAKWLEANK